MGKDPSALRRPASARPAVPPRHEPPEETKVSAKAALTLLFGAVTIVAWFLSARIALRGAGPHITQSRLPVYAFTTIMTVAELVLIASLIFGRNS